MKEVASDWTASPLVRTAINNVADDAEPLDILVELHRLMLDLEEKAPGVPFAKIFAALDEPSADGLAAAARVLLANGHSEEQVDEILRTDAWRQVDRVLEVQRLRADGVSVKEIAAQFNVSPAQVYRWVGQPVVLPARPEAPRREAIGRYAIEHGITAAMQQYGVTARKYVQRCARSVREAAV